MTQIIIDYIMQKKPLPAVYSDEYKLLEYSGTAINDFGDYYHAMFYHMGNFIVLISNLAELHNQ